MSADKNPTTVAPLMAERDRKISSPNGVRGLICVWFFCQNPRSRIYSAPTKFPMQESQEVRDLQGFLVIDCNGYMKFFSAHCGRR